MGRCINIYWVRFDVDENDVSGGRRLVSVD